MQEALACVLMVLSASFYCGFDTAVKEKVVESKYQNSTFFNVECEVQECMGHNLKMYEDGKIIEDGFLTFASVFSGFNNTIVDKLKTELDRCIPEVNQRLDRVLKCSRFQVGMKALQYCVNNQDFKFPPLA